MTKLRVPMLSVFFFLALAFVPALGLAQQPDDSEPALLPELDQDLEDLVMSQAAPPGSGIRLFIEGMSRLEFDISRSFEPRNEVLTGLSLRGRLGAEVPLGDHHFKLLVGDGFRLGQSAQLPLPIVPVTVGRFLYQLELSLNVPSFGRRATLSMGRMPVVVADGRLIGKANFDPRGRSLDGALYSLSPTQSPSGGTWVLRSGLFLLDGLEERDFADISAVGFSELGQTFNAFSWTVYGVLHRDHRNVNLPVVSAFSLGTQLRYDHERWLLDLSLIGQAQAKDPTPLAPEGISGHASLRVLKRFEFPYLGLGGEVTGGQRTEGLHFRRPAGDVHPFLGALDLTAAENVWSVYAEVGLEEEGFVASLKPQLIGITHTDKPWLDALERPFLDFGDKDPLVFFEVDARVQVELQKDITLQGEYGLGVGLGALDGILPVQRFLITLAVNTDTLL